MTIGPEPALAACPACGQPVGPGDNFCESCRAELAPARISGERAGQTAQCPACEGTQIDADSYCQSCGLRVPAGPDHSELELDLLAGVTDRGLRHHRNEDAMALATAQAVTGPAAIAVVCDGVSTSTRPDEAAKESAQAAMAVLLAAARTGGDLAAASRRAFDAAQRALTAMAGDSDPLHGSAPAATFVSAVVTTQDISLCWLGDSRAYWLDASGPADTRQLTSDDSVAQELVSRGLLSAAEALASPAGHVVTGWIGADLSEAKPHVESFTPPGPGALLLCSDGLWNYQPEAAGLAKLALPTALTHPLAAAADLVKFALEAGGHDNITAVLAPFPPRTTRAEQDLAAPEPAPPATAVGSEPPTVQLSATGLPAEAAAIEPPTGPPSEPGATATEE